MMTLCWKITTWGHRCLFLKCCVSSGRGLCDGPITRPEESYQLWCVTVCDTETSTVRRPWPTLGCHAIKKLTRVCHMIHSHSVNNTFCLPENMNHQNPVARTSDLVCCINVLNTICALHIYRMFRERLCSCWCHCLVSFWSFLYMIYIFGQYFNYCFQVTGCHVKIFLSSSLTTFFSQDSDNKQSPLLPFKYFLLSIFIRFSVLRDLALIAMWIRYQVCWDMNVGNPTSW